MSKLYDLVNGATPVVDAPKPTSKLFNLANDLYNRPSPILNTTRSINSAYDDIKLNNDERFTTNPDMYETIFQSQAGNMWNAFKQGIDESQNSNYFASQQKAQNKIDINSKLRKSKAVELGANSPEYQALVQQLNVEDGELQQVVADYQEKIDSNEQEIANEPVSKLYRIKEAVTQAKGGDATTWESVKYTMPSMFGSSASLMGLSVATTFGTGIVKKLVGTLYTGPAAPYVAIGTAILTGLSLASINAEMETQAELGGQIKQAQEMLTAKYMEENGLEDPEQIPPEELENIRMQSMVGIDKLHAEMFAQLAGMNTLEAIVAPLSTFGSGVKAFKVFDTVAKYNKYTRVASTLGRTYLTSTLESQEEGTQFTSEKRQMDAVMGKGDYINKTFIQNLAEDYWDSASSLTLPGTKISGNGKYKDDKMFQFSEDSGGLMGAMFGFTSGGISIIRDIHKYKQTNKELQDKGVLSVDDKIFRYTSQVYAKHFDNDSVEFLLEGVRNLMSSKDENGVPYLTQEEGQTEIKNITSAFDKYLLVKSHIDALPLSKILWNDAKQQTIINKLKSNLLTASIAITRHQDALTKLSGEKAVIKNSNLKDINVNQVNDLTDLINKNTALLTNLETEEVKTLDYHLRVANLTETINTLTKLKGETLQVLKTLGVPFIEEEVSLEQSNKNRDIVNEESFLHTHQAEYQKLLKIKTQKDVESYWNTKKVDEKKVNDLRTKTTAEFNDSLTKLSGELIKDDLLPENSQLHPVLAYKLAKLAGIATKESDKLARIDKLSDKALLLSKELFKFIDPAINPNEALRKAAQGEIDKILLAAKSSEEVRNNLTEIEFFSLINNNPNISPELKAELEAWKAEQIRLQEEEKVRKEQEVIAELEKKAQQQAKDKQTAINKVAQINAKKKEFTFNNQVDAEGNPIVYTSIEVITDNLVTEFPVNLVQKDGTKLQVNLLGQTNGFRNFNLLLPVGELGTNPVGEEASEEDDFSGLQPDLSGYDEFKNAIDDTVQAVRYTLGQIINWVRENGRNRKTGSTFRVIKRQENGEPEVDINHIDVKVDNDALMEFIRNPEEEVTVDVVKDFFITASESEKAKFALAKKLYPEANVAPFGIYDSQGRLLGYIALPKESSGNEISSRQQDAAREYTIALRAYLAEQLIKSKTSVPKNTKADIERRRQELEKLSGKNPEKLLEDIFESIRFRIKNPSNEEALQRTKDKITNNFVEFIGEDLSPSVGDKIKNLLLPDFLKKYPELISDLSNGTAKTSFYKDLGSSLLELVDLSKINAKYDAELAALEEVTSNPTKVTLKVSKDSINKGRLTYRLVRNVIENDLESYAPYRVSTVLEGVEHGIGRWDSHKQEFVIVSAHNIDASVIKKDLKSAVGFSDDEESVKESGNIVAFIRDLTGKFVPVNLFKPKLSTEDAKKVANTIMEMMKSGETVMNIKTAITPIIFATSDFKTDYNSTVIISPRENNDGYVVIFKHGDKKERFEFPKERLQRSKGDNLISDINKLEAELKTFRYNIELGTFTTNPAFYDDKLLTNIIQNNKVAGNIFGEEEYGNQFFSEPQVAFEDPLRDKVESTVADLEKSIAETDQTAVEVEEPEVRSEDDNDNEQDFTKRPDRIPGEDADEKRVAALWTDQKEKDHKEEVDSFFAKNLPGINEVILKDTYSFVNRGRAVFGVFRNMVSVVGENAPLGVRYHEAFHGVFQFLLSDNERSAILAEAREKYGKNFTDKELEEKLADEFMEYKLLAIDPKGLKGLIKRLYHKLLEWINVFNFYPDAINNVFNKIDTAKYAKQSLKHKLSAVQLSQEQVKILNNYYDDADHKVIPGWEHERKNRTIPQMGQDIIKQIKAMKSMDALKAEGGQIALTKALQEKLFENAAARVSISKKVYDAPTTDAYYKVLADITVSYDNLGRRILLPQVKDEVKKYLKRFGIVFSEDKISYLTASNDIAEQISEDIKDLLVQDGETKDYSNTFLQVNAIHSTSFRVKLLLSGINKFNSNGTIVYDSDFTKTPLYDDFVKVYQKLRTAVQNIPETSEVLKTLIELAKTDKQYQQILDVYNAESDWTKSDFLTSLVNELHKDKRILVSNKGNNWVRKMVDSNFTGVLMSNYKEWLQGHSDVNSKKSFYLKNKVDKTVVNELKVRSILKKLKDSPSFLKETTTPYELKKFMDSIGIYFSDDTIKQVVIWLQADTDIFTMGVNGEPTESFRTAISKLLNGILDNYGAYSKMLYELAKLDAQYTTGVVAASYKNVNNDQVFAENRMTPMSKVWFTITGKNRLAAIKELISNDTMYKYNNVLNFISSRPQLTKFLEKVSMGGMKVETNKEGKSFTDAQEVENFVNFLTFFQNKNSNGEDNQEYGLYRTTVPADKTIQYLFKLPKYHTNIINGKIDFENSVGIIDLFYNNIAAEAQRIVKLSKLHREGKIHADSILIGKDASKIKKATGLFPFEKFNFIQELNTEEILAKINELTVDVDFKDNVKEIVKDALHKVLQDDVDSTMEMIANNNLEEIIGENDEDLLQLVTDFVLNSNPALSDLHMLFNGDIAQMPVPQKRSYGAGSLLSTLNTKDPISILGVTAGDIIYDRLFRESPKIRDTAEEEMVKQLQEANNKENNPELWAFLDTPEKIAKKDEELRGIAKDYFDKIAVTDSIVYVSDKFMKKLQVADGKWDNNKEIAFNKFGKGVKLPKTQSGLFTIWKPFYHGLNANKELNIMSLYIIKSSVVMLNANIVKGDPFLENLYAALQKVDMIVTKDSLKAEIPVLHEINKFNLSADFDESTIVNLDSKYFGNQTDNPEHGLDAKGFGRLQTDATFAAAIKDDSTGVADKINKLLADFPNEGLALLTRLKETEPEAYHKYMRDETLSRGVSEATEASLAINPVTGKWEIPFNFSSKQSDLIYMIMSSYSKNSVRMGVSGGKFIQIPSIGFNGKKPRDYNEADIRQNLIDAKVDPEVINLKMAKLKQLKNSLRTIRLENGEVQFVEAYATATSMTFYKYNPKTKEYTLKEMSELTDTEKEQLTILGNRVPYEGLHSLMPIKIIGFLPAEYGSIIVLPYEVTKQMGSDFDLDSIYFRSMAVYIDTEGKTKSYKYGGSLNERYSQYVSWLINEHPVGRDIFKRFKTGLIDKKIDELAKELEEVDEDDVMAFADVLENEYDLVKLKRFKEDLPKLLIKYLKESGLLVNKKDFGDTNNPAAIANELLKTYLEELKKPYMLYHMLRPSGFPEIIAAHKEVMKHKPKSAFRFFSVLGQMDTEKTSHVGMLLKAMAATHVTSHGRSIIMKLMTSNPLRLKSKKKDSDGRNIIDEYGSLSNKYNRHGIFIADEIGSVLAAIMDDLKDQKLADLNINTSTLSFVCLLVRKGIGLEDALYLVNHPVIIENTELSEANSMLFKASDFKYFKTDDQLLAIEDELIKIAEFFPDDEKINNVLKGIGKGIPILDLPTLKRDLEFLNPTKYEALITPLDGEADLQRQKSLFYYKYNAYKLLKVYNDTKTSDLKEITLMNRAMGNLKSLPGNLEEAIIELQYINDTISMISTGTIDNGTESPYISTISGDINKYPSIFSAQRALSYAINDILSNTSYKSDFYKLMMSKIEAAIVRSDKSFMSIKEAGKLGQLRSSIKAFLNQYILLQNTTFFSDVRTKEQQKDFLFRSGNIGLRVMNLKEVTTIRNDAFFKNIETTLSTEKNRQEGLAVVSPKFLGIDKNSENDITDALMFWLDHNNILVNLGTTVEDKKNWNEIFEEAHKVAKDLIKYSLLMNGWQYSPKSLTSLLHPDFFEREGTMKEIKDTNTELNNNTYPNSPELQAALLSAYLRNKQNYKHYPKTSLSDFEIADDIDTLSTSSTKAKYILGFSKLKGVIFAEAIMVKLEEGFTFYSLYKTGVGENGLIDKATYRKESPLGIDKYYLEVHLDDPNTNVSGSEPLETQHETGENEDVEDEDVPGDDEIEEADISSQLKKRIENEATPDKASKIYSLLDETTATPNVEIDDVAGRKASTKRGIVAYRTRGNDFLKAFNEDRTIGNPWSSEGYSLYTATSVKDATIQFIKWLTGEGHTDKQQEYRQAILDNLDNLKGRKIIYYTERNEPSHATALDYLINKYDWEQQPINKEIKPNEKVIPLTTNFSRESVKNDKDYIYLFTDNAKRTSGNNSIEASSWYRQKYTTSYPLSFPSMTQAVARGLNNAFPITTMVDDNRTQWKDNQFDEYKKIIDDEIETIKQAQSKFKGIKFAAQNPFGQGKISNMKQSAPKIWNYLNTKLSEIGIDNTGETPKTLNQSTEIKPKIDSSNKVEDLRQEAIDKATTQNSHWSTPLITTDKYINEFNKTPTKITWWNKQEMIDDINSGKYDKELTQEQPINKDIFNQSKVESTWTDYLQVLKEEGISSDLSQADFEKLSNKERENAIWQARNCF